MERLAADQPIRTKDQDRLNRAVFAKQLAKALAGWRFDESLVVALYGTWGSGKSSIKNLAIESLAKDVSEDDRPDLLQFNPWQFSGQEFLAEAFFREVGKKLRSPKRFFGLFNRIDTKITKQWKSFAEGLNTSTEFLDAAREFIGTAAVLGGTTLFGFGREKAAFIVVILGLMLSTAHRLIKSAANWFGAKAERFEKTIAEIKDDLAESLKKRRRPLLIVIDDIDRLAADEVRMLFRLVKANADLPRLTYLLLFQRDKVEEALNDPNGSGSEFLKKIVQVGFDIPRLEQADIDSIVFAEIGNLLREIPDDTFDSHRWGNLYYGGLRHFFISLRELYRYLGMLEFYQGLFGPAEHLDVNPIDLIAVQVLRVFEPKLYDSLPHMKSVLTGRDFGSIHGNTDESKKRVLALLDGVSAERKSAVTYVLKQLFPPAEWAFDGYNYADGFATKWAKERRICAPGMFDRYFSLRIGAGEISREEIDAVLAMTGDREKLVVELRRFGASNRLKSLLEHLEYYVDDISLVDAVPFVTAIFDVGDELSEDSIITDGLLSGLMHAVRIVYHFVRRIGTKEDVHERERVVEEAIRETTGTIAPCEAVSFEKRRDESRKDDFLISEDRLLDFQSMCVARIESVAEDNSILGSGHMVTLLRYWNEWAGKERPRKWVDNIVEAGNAPQLLARFVQKGTTTGLGEYVSRIREYVDLRVVEFLIEPDRVEDALRDVRLDDLTADQRKGVELFRKGLALKRSGKGNRRPWDPDDE